MKKPLISLSVLVAVISLGGLSEGGAARRAKELDKRLEIYPIEKTDYLKRVKLDEDTLVEFSDKGYMKIKKKEVTIFAAKKKKKKVRVLLTPEGTKYAQALFVDEEVFMKFLQEGEFLKYKDQYEGIIDFQRSDKKKAYGKLHDRVVEDRKGFGFKKLGMEKAALLRAGFAKQFGQHNSVTVTFVDKIPDEIDSEFFESMEKERLRNRN